MPWTCNNRPRQRSWDQRHCDQTTPVCSICNQCWSAADTQQNPSDVRARFETHADNFLEEFGDTAEHQQLIEYFENTYVGRLRRSPLFPPEMWNCKDITEQNLPRTINSVESWHHQLQRAFFSPHPNFFKFLEGYLQEQIRANAVCVKLDAGEELPLYARKEYQQANRRLLNILARYNETYPDDFLSQCAY